MFKNRIKMWLLADIFSVLKYQDTKWGRILNQKKKNMKILKTDFDSKNYWKNMLLIEKGNLKRNKKKVLVNVHRKNEKNSTFT